jgi:COMPASS component SPP1
MDAVAAPSYVVPDPDPVRSRGITETEYDLLFGETADEENEARLGFVHNDLNESNIIVQDGKIVGLVDWEMAGFFWLNRAGRVHALFRTARRENLQNANLTEEQIVDLTFWNDLYVGL